MTAGFSKSLENWSTAAQLYTKDSILKRLATEK